MGLLDRINEARQRSIQEIAVAEIQKKQQEKEGPGAVSSPTFKE